MRELTDNVIRWLETLGGKGKTSGTAVRQGPLPDYLRGLPRTDRIALFLQNISPFRGAPDEIESLKSALEAQDPDQPYDDWLQNICALKHDADKLVGPHGSDYAFELANAYCLLHPEKYAEMGGEEGLQTKWGKIGDHDNPVHVDTIFYKARARGWTESGTYEVNGHASASVFVRQTDTPIQLDWFDADEFDASPAPPRNWLIEDWLPGDNVTMLAGEGGTGKSTLALQLAIAATRDTDWLGLKVSPGNVLYFSAEENRDELHYRWDQMRGARTAPALHKFRMVDYSVRDALLANAKGETQLLHKLEADARTHDARLVILDAAANVFGGDEINRVQVSTFVSSLRRMSRAGPAAVLLIAHPSLEGIKSERGYSGSTGWHNSVRGRWYFKKLKLEAGQPDLKLHALQLEKTRSGRQGEQIMVRWHEGRYVLAAGTSTAQSASMIDAENNKFLELLAYATARGQHVTAATGWTYAPTMFEKHYADRLGGFTKQAMVRALNRLLDSGRVRLVGYGPPSRGLKHLVIATQI